MKIGVEPVSAGLKLDRRQGSISYWLAEFIAREGGDLGGWLRGNNTQRAITDVFLAMFVSSLRAERATGVFLALTDSTEKLTNVLTWSKVKFTILHNLDSRG